MNKNSRPLTFSMLVLAVFVIAACILRTLACVWHLEENLVYFSEQPIINAANIIVVMGSILLLALGFTMKKQELRASFTTPATYVPTGMVAVSLVFFAFSMTAIYVALGKAIPTPKVNAAQSLALATAILAPISIIHFFLTAFLSERRTRLRAYFSLGTVLMLCAYAAYLYFSTATPLNAQNKIAEQMACLFSALFFLYETRISLGREMWRSYASVGTVAALLSAYASIPSLITYFIRGICPGGSVESAAMLFTISVFIFARLCVMTALSPDVESAEMAVLREYAQRRENELRDGKIEDGTQISITELIDIPKETIDESEAQEPQEESGESESTPPTDDTKED